MNPCDFTLLQGGKRSDFYPIGNGISNGKETDLSLVIIILIIIVLMIGFQD
jgi:hypothetical protein